MGIPRQHVDSFDFIAADFKIQHLIRSDFPLLDQSVACHNDKKFPLGMMSVLALGNARQRHIDTELTALFGTQQLREASPGIAVHF